MRKRAEVGLRERKRGANRRAKSEDREGEQAEGDAARGVLDSIRRIVRMLRLFDRQAERRVGLSGAQVFVLQTLRDGRAISINNLAWRTHTDQSSVSVVVRKLAGRGLIRRTGSAADGRRVEVALTDRGKALLRRSPAAAQQRMIAALHRMSESRRESLAKLLAEMNGWMGIEGDKPTLFFESHQ